MRILVTGITSALGDAVAHSLAEHEVLGLARKAHPRFRTIICDFRNDLPRLPSVDVCLHMAAITDAAYCRQWPSEARRVNVSATSLLLRCAARFVYVSTGSVYGYQCGPATEDQKPRPMNEYAESKFAAEEEVGSHANAVALRFFFPYGPRTKPDALINRLIGRIASGQAIEVPANGGPRTNPVFVSDVVRATKAFCLETLNGVFNVAGNEVVSIRELAEMIGDILGKSPVFRSSGDNVQDLAGSTEKMRTVFTPTVDLRSGLRKTIAHLAKPETVR